MLDQMVSSKLPVRLPKENDGALLGGMLNLVETR